MPAAWLQGIARRGMGQPVAVEIEMQDAAIAAEQKLLPRHRARHDAVGRKAAAQEAEPQFPPHPACMPRVDADVIRHRATQMGGSAGIDPDDRASRKMAHEIEEMHPVILDQGTVRAHPFPAREITAHRHQPPDRALGQKVAGAQGQRMGAQDHVDLNRNGPGQIGQPRGLGAGAGRGFLQQHGQTRAQGHRGLIRVAVRG